jgi:hypothetical protein
VLVERGDALAADKLAGDRIVLGGDQGGERLPVDLLVEVGEFAAQVVDDAVGADGVDPGVQDEGAVAVRPREPGEVADVGRSRLGKVRGRRIALAGAAILEQPAASVVLVEAEGGIALENLADDGRERGPQITMRLSRFRSSSPPRGMYSAVASSWRSRARSARSWAPTWLAAPLAVRIWCSPRRAVAR